MQPHAWSRWRLVSEDMEDHHCLLPGWTHTHVQLDRGRFERAVEGVTLDARMQVFRERTNRRLHRVVRTPPDTWAMALLAADSAGMRFQSRHACAGDLLVMPADRVFDMVTLGVADLIVATLEAQALPVGPDIAVPTGGTILPPSAATKDLGGAMLRVLSAPEQECALRRKHLKAQLTCHLVDCLHLQAHAAVVRDAGGKDLALLEAARRLLLARAQVEGQAPRVPELADELGISARRLHQLFQSRLGVPPRAYAERVRLTRARAELRRRGAAGVTVASVATRWGFDHLGRFSSLYRTFFGELPSDTVRN